MAYVKLFSSLLNSTVWSEPLPTRVVWISLLALADQDGVVHARAPGIAKAAGVTRSECDAALATFCAPDPDSRTRDHEGKRIEETKDGFRLLNYEAYRDMASKEERLAKANARQQRWRKRNATPSTNNAPVTHHNAPTTRVTHSVSVSVSGSPAEVGSDALEDAHPLPPEEFPGPDPDLVWLNRQAADRGWMGSLFASDRSRMSAQRVIELAKTTAQQRDLTDWRPAFGRVFAAWIDAKPARINLANWPAKLAEDWHQSVRSVDGAQ